MAQLSIVGIDLAKNVFQLHGVDERGKQVLQRKLRRSQLALFVGNLGQCTIAMEACSGAHAWARKFRKMGHQAVLISPQYVKPFVKTNKSDKADAEAICEAAARPSIPHVAIKEPWHSEMQSLHRIRGRHMKNRTALCNEIRGILAEYGITIPRGPSHIKRTVPAVLDGTISCEELSENIKLAIGDMYSELAEMEKKIKKLDGQIELLARGRADCKRLMEIPGVGILTATALLAKMPNPAEFKNGRQFSAYLGLVPRHEGTGGKNRNLGLSKRGDRYLRTLLVHGARSIVRIVNLRDDNTCRWTARLKEKKGANRAAVALANKNARIAWQLVARGQNYDKQRACIPKEAVNA